MSDTCGWCGNPATGLASICEVRLCHGDDDPEPTCYQLQQWEISATGSFLLQLHIDTPVTPDERTS